VLRNGQLLAGDRQGVFRWEPAAESWLRVSDGERRFTAVRALVQDDRGSVFAASEEAGVFVSSDDGTTWVPANDGLTDLRVLSLAAGRARDLYAGTARGVFRGSVVERR
jgi:ligand-binding sensor domain-containing protein